MAGIHSQAVGVAVLCKEELRYRDMMTQIFLVRNRIIFV